LATVRVIVTFSLPDQDGNIVTSDEFAGRPLIMFFYPAAMTAGCTLEACEFRDNYRTLEDAGYEVVGVSPDLPAKNAKFKEQEGLPFRLLSDQDHALAAELGAWGTKTNYGKSYEGLIRSTFVIGPDGEIERSYRNVKAKGHVARVTADLLGD
jgi:peroxiredoxin Q/BCP